MKYRLLILIVTLSGCALLSGEKPQPWLTENDYPFFYESEVELLSIEEIWNNGNHLAFTDIELFKDEFYIVFRESKIGHNADDGIIRVIKSRNGEHWELITTISLYGLDLRDPKLNISPDQNLTISAGARYFQKDSEKYIYSTYMWKSDNGRDWSESTKITEDNKWLWDFTWNKKLNIAYGFSYKTGGGRSGYISLNKSLDGINFNASDKITSFPNKPSESDVVFLENSKLGIALSRRSNNNPGAIGYAREPFDEWIWSDLNLFIASPNLLLLPDNRIIAGLRLNEPDEHTSISIIDPVNKNVVDVLALPSFNDTGYPGLILKNDTLYVSYYTTIKYDRTSINFVKIKI